jgi:hypothetical protein
MAHLMKALVPFIAQSGIGDMSALSLIFVLSIWPYHVANLFVSTPAIYSLPKSIIQCILLSAFLLAAVGICRKATLRWRYKLLFVFGGYPAIVFGSNFALGL